MSYFRNGSLLSILANEKIFLCWRIRFVDREVIFRHDVYERYIDSRNHMKRGDAQNALSMFRINMSITSPTITGLFVRPDPFIRSLDSKAYFNELELVGQQSCRTCSNFFRVKVKVFKLPQNMAFSNSNIYKFKII